MSSESMVESWKLCHGAAAPTDRTFGRDFLHTGEPADGELAFAVAKLLAIAVDVSASPTHERTVATVPVPVDFTEWPSVQTELIGAWGVRTIRFYVSPKAFGLSVDDPFPVGTTLIVETIPASIPRGWEVRSSYEARGVTRFVMTKCGHIDAGLQGNQTSHVWVYGYQGPAKYGLSEIVSGVSRLSTGETA
ncbi:hypothetical protein YTPLAS18_06190 [Nitrospira sp.]|nr:hypothetical protein YTPLAS18_06190 [Nitrospira sp.]